MDEQDSEAKTMSRGSVAPAARAKPVGPVCFGIPDLRIPLLQGGEINPADFAGHELVVLFCPRDRQAAERELESYASCAQALADAGAWFIGILASDHSDNPWLANCAHLTIAIDDDGAIWQAFEGLLDQADRTEEAEGGVFLFERGGCLERAWPGTGHARDVLSELRRLSS